MEKINIYEIVVDRIRSLDIYRKNKQILKALSHLDTAEYLMHKFFIENDYGSLMPTLNSLESMLNEFLENYILDIQEAESERNRINKATEKTIKELEKNNLQIDVTTGQNEKTTITEKQNKADFVKSIDYDSMSKYTAYINFLTAVRGGDIFEKKEDNRHRKSKLAEKEEFKKFFGVYKSEIAQGLTHKDIIAGYEKQNKCTGYINNEFYKQHKDKALSISPNLTTLQKLFNYLIQHTKDINKLF